MLFSERENFQSGYFIDERMKNEYIKGDFKEVLLLRKQLIISAEKYFVENLGIKYIQIE